MSYESDAIAELREWQKAMSRRPSITNKLAKALQSKVNSLIPEKVHVTLTNIIKQMVRGVLFGSTHTTSAITKYVSLQALEEDVKKRIDFYKHAGAAEGGITGAAGFLAGLADFPILLSLKLKMLFDIAAYYGHSVKDYRERIYILYIFQLAFSSQDHRRKIYEQMQDWDIKKELLPDDINAFDWRSFQQEYRDYIDLAKMAQLIPGIGAVIGFVVNYKLLNKLGVTAMNAYRTRINTINQKNLH